jgi:hypothetical protein
VHVAGAVEVIFVAELVEQVGERDFGPRGFAGADDLAPGCFGAGDFAVAFQQAVPVSSAVGLARRVWADLVLAVAPRPAGRVSGVA